MMKKDHDGKPYEETSGPPTGASWDQRRSVPSDEDPISPEIRSTTPVGRTRKFSTGATRDTDSGKLQYAGFLSPLVLRRYAEFMHKHRKQSDGKLRAADNWQKGLPLEVYMDSGWRHFMDWWGWQRKWWDLKEGIEEVLCALLFNVMGALHVILKRKLAPAFIEYVPGGPDDPTIKNRDRH